MPIMTEMVMTCYDDIHLMMYHDTFWTMDSEDIEKSSTPHFHAHCKSSNHNSTITIDIKNCCVARFNQGGYRKFPEEKLNTILLWCRLHKGELLGNWERVKNGQCLISIPPPNIK